MTLASAKDDGEPDWAEVVTFFLIRTNMSYDEILERTPVQIRAIQSVFEKLSTPKEGGQVDDKPPKLSQLDEFCRLFRR